MPLQSTSKPIGFINTTTLAQLSESEIRALNPNTSYPVPFLEPEGYAFIFPAPQPAHDPVTQRVQAIAPELTTLGHWEQRWEVVDLYATQEEKDEAIAADLEAKRVASIPASVTMRQARLALLGAGLLSTVETAIAGAGPAAKIEWEYAQEVQRAAGLVPAMATALGMSEVQIDALFVEAATL